MGTCLSEDSDPFVFTVVVPSVRSSAELGERDLGSQVSEGRLKPQPQREGLIQPEVTFCDGISKRLTLEECPFPPWTGCGQLGVCSLLREPHGQWTLRSGEASGKAPLGGRGREEDGVLRVPTCPGRRPWWKRSPALPRAADKGTRKRGAGPGVRRGRGRGRPGPVLDPRSSGTAVWARHHAPWAGQWPGTPSHRGRTPPST